MAKTVLPSILLAVGLLLWHSAAVSAAPPAAANNRRPAQRPPRPPKVRPAKADSENGPPAPLFLAAFDNGQRVTGPELTNWSTPEQRAYLGGRPLMGDDHARWMEDLSLPPADPPDAFVEFANGDRLAGRVTGPGSYRTPDGVYRPGYLMVAPEGKFDRPGGVPRNELAIDPRWVKRIVWQSTESALRPGTVFARDGRQLAFRSYRFGESSLRLLRAGGVEEIALSAVAELHLPAGDAWEAYCDEAAAALADGSQRTIVLQTVSGSRLSAWLPRFRTERINGEPNLRGWLHMIQPVWTPEPIWLSLRDVRVWQWPPLERMALTRFEPVETRRDPVFSESWTFQADESVQGGPLESSDARFGWGFGVQAPSLLEFALPDAALRLRTRVGLDRLAGRGGCAKASVRCGDQTLFESRLLIGAQPALDSGWLALPAGAKRRLRLEADMAHDQRPAAADPFDIRDLVDWFEPELSIDRAVLEREAKARRTKLVPAWRNWTLVEPAPEKLALHSQVFGDRYDWVVGSPTGPIVLRRKATISASSAQLNVFVRTADGGREGKIEVRVEGQSVAEAAPLNRPGYWRSLAKSRGGNRSSTVSLREWMGQSVTIEVVCQGQDTAPLEWIELELAAEK